MKSCNAVSLPKMRIEVSSPRLSSGRMDIIEISVTGRIWWRDCYMSLVYVMFCHSTPLSLESKYSNTGRQDLGPQIKPLQPQHMAFPCYRNLMHTPRRETFPDDAEYIGKFFCCRHNKMHYGRATFLGSVINYT